MAHLTPPGFAVTGTGGCGTRYVATVLAACEVRCGHERWWTPLERDRTSGLDGDSSWLAVPDIEDGGWSGPVLHITRHPVLVVRNLLHGLFSPHAGYPQFGRFALAQEPELAGLDRLHAAVEWWVRWNRRCAAAADLTMPVTEFVARLGEVEELIGHRLDPATASRVSRDINHRPSAPVDAAVVWRLLSGRAAEFGYHPDERGESCG